MSYTEHGVKQGFLFAINRCIANSFFTVAQEAWQTKKNRPVAPLAPRIPNSLSRERYLAIPTFIRQGKTLGL